jgi:hypothetical protein
MPGHAGPTDADRITNGAALTEHEIKLASMRDDHDVARPIVAERHHLARSCRARHAHDQRAGEKKPLASRKVHRSTITGVPTATKA